MHPVLRDLCRFCSIWFDGLLHPCGRVKIIICRSAIDVTLCFLIPKRVAVLARVPNSFLAPNPSSITVTSPSRCSNSRLPDAVNEDLHIYHKKQAQTDGSPFELCNNRGAFYGSLRDPLQPAGHTPSDQRIFR